MGNEEKASGRKNSRNQLDDSGRDARFDVFGKNPIYRRVPKNQKRLQIDSRFKSMFHDDQFKLTYKVDKRGRPINTTTNENLKKYYKLQKEDDEDEDDKKCSETEESESELEEPTSSKVQNADSIKRNEAEDSDSGENESDSNEEGEETDVKIDGNVLETEIRKRNKSNSNELTKIIKKKLHDAKVDYARGEGVFISDESESDDSSSSEEDDIEDVSHAWGELDRDADRVEKSTSRLALCNMDWDRVKAVDLMVLFHSFVPSKGVLKCVTIYPSEFGKQRLADEEINGPQELRVEKDSEEEIDSENNDDDHKDDEPINEDDEEGGGFHMEKLRTYQLNRLKYFYAVLEFDIAETAEKVYTECDGMEYESSATHIDLRYIPEDMEFDKNDIKDQCNQLADAEKYRPRIFTTTALQQAKVSLTWDETDPMRKELTERVYNPKDTVDDDDLRTYLASSSDSEEELEIKKEDVDSDDEDEKVSVSDPMAKYRALLDSIEENEKKKKDKDVEMEITWGVGLKAKTESRVREILDKEAAAKLTPWEEILAKKKEKSKKKRHDKKKSEGKKTGDDEASGEEGDVEEQPFSDDDIEVDMNDPFFKEELKTNKLFKQKPSKKKGSVSAPESVDKAALELLLMDDQDNKHHFNLKSIIDRETASKSKKKKLKKKHLKNKVDEKNIQDDFEVDVDDNRFSALFSSHLFNVDPSDQNFKNTRAMKTIMTEKQKRRLAEVQEDEKSTTEVNAEDEEMSCKTKKSKANSAELSLLVKSIKRNTSNLKSKQKYKS